MANGTNNKHQRFGFVILLTMSTISNGSRIFWKTSSSPPSQLSSKNPFLSTLVPRMFAWFSVDDEKVALLDGYSAVCYTPPTIAFGVKTLPPEMIKKLEQTKVCTLSSATVRESDSSYTMAACLDGESPKSFTFDEIGLKSSKSKEAYPVAVATAPIKMHCSLEKIVDLGDGESMILLTVETFVVDGSVLSPPTEMMTGKGRDIKAKIDAELIKPVVGLGNGAFSPLTGLRSMPRPKKQDAGGWVSDPFDVSCLPTLGEGEYGAMEWSFREHGAQCPLGYNPITALIMPRPIGWISTYEREGRTEHIAPYSFFTDVARGKQPMVIFSGARGNGGEIKKDAQKDSEEMGCFVYNMVSEDLAVSMNLSAAEMGRNESEFELAGLSSDKANLVDAPVVKDAHVKYECEYVKTVDVASFSIVIGKVVGVTVDESILTDGRVDPLKAKPILRLGYMDEYGLVSQVQP
jgi:flavin reductase (DIM6/NTAB) family NADH-FMN oxidoreductase RutF